VNLPDRADPMARRQRPEIGPLMAELMSLLDIGHTDRLDG
jgi:hypothetical protein